MKKQILIISGQPGTGKTTLGRHFAEYLDVAFLDKDIVCDFFTFFIMETVYSQNDNKDSLEYHQKIRPLEYSTFSKLMFSQIECNVSFVAVAPFSTEIKKHSDYFDKIEEDARLKEYDVYFIHLIVDELELRDRIIKRSKPEDKRKLERWSEYVNRFSENDLRSNIKTFVNSNIDDTIEDIMNYIN